MCYSFGFFRTDRQNMKVLRNFYCALKPGGKFLMETDVNLPRVRSGKYFERKFRNLFSGNKLKVIDNYNPKTKRMEGSWIIIRPDGKEIKKDYSVRVYEKDEFCKMCLRVGFRKCTAFSSWRGKPYSEKSQQIIFVAQK